jgi:hypothetical protein
MSAATSFTYDANPPARPSLDDLGGDDFEDDPGAPPPKDGRMPYADEYCESKRNLAGVNRVIHTAIVHVVFTGGTPSIANVRGMRSTLLPTDFTPTDNGAGDTTITWASSLLPASSVPPTVSLTDDVEIDRARAFLVTGGVRVKTKLGTTGTDCAFVLLIH